MMNRRHERNPQSRPLGDAQERFPGKFSAIVLCEGPWPPLKKEVGAYHPLSPRNRNEKG